MIEDSKIEAMFGYKLLRPEMPVKIVDVGDNFDCFVGPHRCDEYGAAMRGMTIGLAIGLAIT